MSLPFDGLKEVLEKMTPEYRAKLIYNYKRFAELKAFCAVRGYIEVLPQMKGIKVLKKTAEVKELKGVIDILKPGNFKWEDPYAVQPIEAKTRKKTRAKAKK
jgi:hypothetical protein